MGCEHEHRSANERESRPGAQKKGSSGAFLQAFFVLQRAFLALFASLPAL